MKRFQFPLDTVLRYRQLQAEAEEVRLQALLARLAETDVQIAQVDREGLRTEEAVRQSLAPQLEVIAAEMAAYPDYRLVLARGRKALLEQRRQRFEEIERQRANVLAAYRAREILERAREQAQRQWQADYRHEMEATAGELFLSKRKRRRTPGVR